MRKLVALAFFFSFYNQSGAQFTSQQYREDFLYLWKQVADNYAYLDEKNSDWSEVKQKYSAAMDTVHSSRSFVLLLEKVFNELYDHHASLNTNTRQSQRLVPSGTDIYAAFSGNRAIITDVRKDFGAYKAGLRAGMEVLAVNDVPVDTAIKAYLPTTLRRDDKAAKDYALRILLAGKYWDDRKITVKHQQYILDFYPDRPHQLLIEHKYPAVIESRVYNGNIGYIRINDGLGDNRLIPVFDSVLQSLKNTNGIILDLRETPSGGNTTVARAIIGSFIKKEGFYQKHQYTPEEKTHGIKRSWVEIVSPRRFVYSKPLVVLVNRWTGSVAEAIAIGLDALEAATVIGTPMAGLRGAVYSFTMPHTKIGFSFPVEKLYHVNGLPREDYLPPVLIEMQKEKEGGDLVLAEGLRRLKKNGSDAKRKTKKVNVGNSN